MDGVINIDKPRGMTSYDVVAVIKRICHQRKVGHTGTLDPDAAGVLPICIGRATKIVRFLVETDKEYEATLVLGVVTDTQDSKGKVLKKEKVELEKEEVDEVFARFRGKIWQIPPMVSAVHHQGRRLYQLAREGMEVERKPRQVEIFDLEMVNCRIPEVDFRVVCSKGTYVRTLCVDMGEALGCGGHQANLTRTRSGSFRLEDAVSLEKLQQGENLEQFLISMDEALSYLPCLQIRKESRFSILQGHRIYSRDLVRATEGFKEGDLVRIHGPDGTLISIARMMGRAGDEISLRSLRIL